MLRRAIFIVILLIAAAIGGGAFYLHHSKGPAVRYKNANVILISIDTLRADVLGFMGAKGIATPNIDALAAKSIIFEQATAAANHTAPSHASMLTGMAVPAHGVLNIEASKKAPTKIPNSIPTIAERLKAHGYKTAARADGGYVIDGFGFGRGFDTFESGISGMTSKFPSIEKYIDSLGGASGFLFLHTYEVHAPYPIAPSQHQKIAHQFKESVIPARHLQIYSNSGDLAQRCAALFDGSKNFTDADRACLRAYYETSVENMDRMVGSLMKMLESKGILNNTILIFTSDHGEAFGEHGRYQHESLHDEIVHIPLLIRLPDGAMAGRRIPFAFSAIDLVPTILDLLNLPAPNDIEGESRLSLMIDHKTEADRVAFSTLDMDGEIAGCGARTPREKLVYYNISEREIRRGYDLVNDPLEKNPLDGQQFNTRMKSLEESLRIARRLWKSLAETHLGNAESAVVDESTLRDLRALGYVR